MPVSIAVRRFLVRSLDIDFNEITWELESTTEDVLDYTFQLLKSEAAEGPYSAVTPELSDEYRFIDNSLKEHHAYRQTHYKLVVKHKASGNTEEVGPASREPEADLIAVELRKHVNILMREFIGRRCWVFPVRTFGQRCTCTNTVLQKRRISGCLSCFDTGFVRGYMRPVETWMSIDPNPNTEQNTTMGPLHQNDTTARLGYYPPLKPRDILVEPENRRWRVSQVNQTEQLRAPLHQEIQIHQIPSGDIEYKIRFDPGDALTNLFFSPARSFTNPQNLESFKDEEIPDIFSLYPTSYAPVK